MDQDGGTVTEQSGWTVGPRTAVLFGNAVSHSGMRTAVPALLLVGVLAGAGCSSEDEPDASDPTTTTETSVASTEPKANTEPTTVPADPTPRAQVSVPDVTGLRAGPATVQLNEVGLRVRRVTVMGTACRPRGRVLGQTPRVGADVQTGRRVRIELNSGAARMCGLEAERANEDLQRVATAFVRFAQGRNAQGKRPGPPVDTPITLLVGGGEVKVIDGEAQSRPRAWASCPTSGTYAGRTCPINPLRAIAAHFGPLALIAQLPTHPCAHPQLVTPGDVGATQAVTITPDEALDCTSWWAVELFVNDVGQVVAVNTVRAEP